MIPKDAVLRANDAADFESAATPSIRTEAAITAVMQEKKEEHLSSNKSHQHAKHTTTASSSAQVAPLPRMEGFQVGKILNHPHHHATTTTETDTPHAIHEVETNYIPVALAKAHLAKVVADMHAMKDEQALKIAQILERYKAMEQDTQLHYEKVVHDAKSKAKRKIQDEQLKYETLERVGHEKAAHAQREYAALAQQREQDHIEYEAQQTRWKEQFETCLQRHEDEMAKCQVLVASEVQRAADNHDRDTSAKLTLLRNELLMSWEDAKSDSLRVVHQLAQLRKELAVKEKAFLRRVQCMQTEFDTDQEVLKCLNSAVNRVVDMAQQQSVRKKTSELSHEISRLESEVRESVARETSLQHRLAAAREQYEQVQRASVCDTMELILQTIEVAPSTPPRATVPPRVSATTAIQTDVLMRDEQRPLLPLPQLQYESDVERLRERNREIVHSKQRLREQKAQLQQLLETKNAAKASIKAWLADFQKENGRDPAIEDKAQVKDLYLSFKEREDAYTRKKEHVAQLKAQHHAKVVEIETVAQWQALSGAVVAQVSDRSAASTATSSRANSRPPSSSLSMRESPPSTGKVVSTLEHELEHLRQELALVKANRNNDAGGPKVAEPESALGAAIGGTEAVVGTGAAPGVPTAPNGQESSTEELRKSTTLATIDPQELAEEGEEATLQTRKQQQLVSQAMELHQATLQLTITQLTEEIEIRNEEKRKLETEIEQLRLHLELMEFNHDHHDQDLDQSHGDGHPVSEEKVSLSRNHRDSRERKRIVPENQLFDEEEAVEDEDAMGGREDRGSDEELLDADVDEEGSGDEEDDSRSRNGDDAIAEAKGSSDPLSLEQNASRDLESDDKDDKPQEEQEDAARCQHLSSLIKDAIEQGKAQFNRGDKTKCYQTYVKASEKCVEQLRGMHHHQNRREELAAFKQALGEASRLPAARGSMVLRKQLDGLLVDCDARLQDRDARIAAKRQVQLERAMAAAALRAEASAPSSTTPSKQRSSVKRSTHKKATPPDLDLDNGGSASPTKLPSSDSSTPAASAGKGASNSSSTSAAVGGRVLEEYKQKLKALEAKARADKVKITQLEASLAKVESQVSASAGSNTGNAGGSNSAVLERKMADMEKKHKHALDDAEKAMKREISSLSQQLQTAQTKSSSLQDQVAQCQKELSLLGGKATQLNQLEGEMVVLRQQASQAAAFSQELTTVKQEFGKLESSYKEEQSLRKKYYNMIEDMKGKIRVYARCRPMSGSEVDRGCSSCVKFVDEYSLELETSRGPKPFAYDQVFSSASSQDQVFEDTKNLLQSAIDGYNVCIFAYGQTGSGKTFTMTGTESMPGLSPRAIHHLFALADEGKGNNVVTFQAFMLELYNDNLIDLFHLVDSGMGHDKDAPKLEIKKNEKGMVFVQNITMKACTTPQQTLKLFEMANKKRQVGSTKMNAESSRSHSVFSILVENYNKTTKATSVGKLSLVDLAGSERAGKTGATAERLKEAQAINKSLSGEAFTIILSLANRWRASLHFALLLTSMCVVCMQRLAM